ncbi:hypothetical protein EVAR_65653_1 [Eumeta japonica]|uniref:Uncharacterized protein n=1 Tax=Eumeta variegata TaxID=151549 RepID=A0A4C1ZAC5_EUMVA|nr:hypothetical protein EVAR_65653_1 [Eumeta japonica]
MSASNVVSLYPRVLLAASLSYSDFLEDSSQIRFYVRYTKSARKLFLFTTRSTGGYAPARPLARQAAGPGREGGAAAAGEPGSTARRRAAAIGLVL